MNPMAVITGDLIGSTGAERARIDSSMVALAGFAAQLDEWLDQPTRFTRFRGDGWHMLLCNPSQALQITLWLMAGMAAYRGSLLSSRFALGIGSVAHVGSANLSDAHGEAFVASGRALERMSGRQLLAFGHGPTTGLAAATFALVDEIALRWTIPQAEALHRALALDTPSRGKIAIELGITPQALSYRLSGAGLRNLKLAVLGWSSHFEARPAEGVAY